MAAAGECKSRCVGKKKRSVLVVGDIWGLGLDRIEKFTVVGTELVLVE